MRVEIEAELPVRRARGPRAAGAPVPEKAAAQLRRPERLAHQLALAYHIDAIILRGEVADLAEVAKLCGVSRARVSQIRNRLALPVAEQEGILSVLPSASPRPSRL